MRNLRVISPPFSRTFRSTPQNATFSSSSQTTDKSDLLLGFIRSKHGLSSPPNTRRRSIWPWNPSTYPREFTSSTQESNPAPPSASVSAIVDDISGLTLLEVADLTDVLRKRLGVEEMPFIGEMTPGMNLGTKGPGKGSVGAKEEEKVAEKTAFNLKLEGVDAASKLKVIKEVRTFTSLGLKEAKDLVEKAPTLLKAGVTKEEAEAIIEKMKAVGAKVTME